MNNNNLNWVYPSPILQANDIKDCNVENTGFNSNSVKTDELIKFAFAEFSGTEKVKFLNQNLLGNSIAGKVEFFKFLSQKSPLLSPEKIIFDISKLRVSQNKVLYIGNEFSYLSLKGFHIEKFDVSEIEYSKNVLPGTFFSLRCAAVDKFSSETLLQKPPNKLNFSNIKIIDNQQALSASFLEFSATFLTDEKKNNVQLFESYIIQLSNSKISNNKFKNSKTDQWASEASLFEIEEARLYLNNVEIKDNTFTNFHVISLEQKPSTVIITSSNLAYNTFDSSQFIHSNYLPELKRAYLGKDPASSSAIPLYRVIFIINSNFRTIHVKNSVLISSKNGFVSLKGNTFLFIYLKDSTLLETNFHPLPLMENTAYIENLQVQEISLWEHTEAKHLFTKTLAEAKLYKSNNLYFISLEGNEFCSVNLMNSKLVSLKGFDFSQTFIQIRDSIITDFEDEEDQSIVFEIDSFNFLAISNNTISSRRPIPLVVSITQGKNSQLLEVSSNKITRQIVSFLHYNGKSIARVKVSNNKLYDVNFLFNCIALQVIEATERWAFSGNIITSATIRDREFVYQALGSTGFINVNVFKSKEGLYFDDNYFANIQATSYYMGYSFMHLQTSQPIFFNNFTTTDSNIRIYFMTVLNSDAVTFKDSTIQKFKNYLSESVLSLNVPHISIINMTCEDLTIVGKTGFFSLTSPRIFFERNIEISDSLFSFQGAGSFYGGFIHLQQNAGDEEYLYLDMSNTTVIMPKQKPVLYLSHMKCRECNIKNCTFGTIETSSQQIRQKEGLFEFVDEVEGEITFSEILFKFQKPLEKPLIWIQYSTINVDLKNILYNGNNENLYLVSMDSGGLSLADCVFEDISVSNSSLINIAPFFDQRRKMDGSFNPRILFTSTTFRNIVSKKPEVDISSFLSYALSYKYNYEQNVTLAILSSVIPSQIGIFDSTFEHLQGMPAIFIADTAEVNYEKRENSFLKIGRSKFKKIRFNTGPAITIFPNNFILDTQYSFVNIYDSTFEDNKAVVGGALFIYNASLALVDLTFRNNEASFIGAAIFTGGFSTQYPLSHNLYENNKAPYEGNYRSEAINLRIAFVPHEETVIKQIETKSGGSFELKLEDVSNTELRAGMFAFTYVDNEGRSTPDFAFTKSVMLEAPQNTKASLPPTFKAESPSFSELGGYFYLRNIIMYDQANENVPLIMKYTSDTINVEKEIILSIRDCFIGEEKNTQTGSCEKCKAGTYSVEAGKHCIQCPETAQCLGGSNLLPYSGYWNTEKNPEIIVPCRSDGISRCTNTEGQKNCAEGYTGPLCEACDFENSYVEKGFLECGRCENSKKSLFYNIIFGILYFAYQLFSMKTIYIANQQVINSQANFLAERKVERSFYLKSFLTYTQLMSIIYMSSPSIHQVLGLASEIGDPSALITYSTQCSLLALGITYSNLIFYQTYIIAFSPLIQLAFILIVLLLVKIFKRTLPIKKILPVAILYFTISYQPGVVSNLALFQSCTTLKGLGYYYIAAHPSWSCNTANYSFVVDYVARPSLILWSIVLPVLILFGLFKYKKHLETGKMRSIFGMIISDVKNKYFYWGIIMMALKLVLSFLAMSLREKVELQILAILVLIWGYQSLVKFLKPFHNQSFNNFEVTVMNLLIFNIIVFKYLLDPANGEFLSKGFLILCIILNGGFILMVGWKILTLTFLSSIALVERKIMKRRITRDSNLSQSFFNSEL